MAAVGGRRRRRRASGVLAVQVLDSDRTADTNVAPASIYVERGSIAAIDHLAEQGARVADVSRVAVERGSITALDHARRAEPSVTEPAELVAERGSITALDHLAEQDGARRRRVAARGRARQHHRDRSPRRVGRAERG